MTATIVTTSDAWALAFLSLAYAGILAQQPNLCAVCLDTGRKKCRRCVRLHEHGLTGRGAGLVGAFGYLVGYFGNYNAPLVPMVLLLCAGAWLWLTVDPAQELFDDCVAPRWPRLNLAV